jgi:hypothetical protein
MASPYHALKLHFPRYSQNQKLKNKQKAECLWLTPVILAT